MKICVTANAQSDGFEVKVTSQKCRTFLYAMETILLLTISSFIATTVFEMILIDDLPTRQNVVQGRFLCEAIQARRRDSALLA